jgi:hypothetical protein
MTLAKRIGWILLAFFGSSILTTLANFVLQIVITFLDVVTRWEESSGSLLALWLVTGVFTTVFTTGMTERLGAVPGGDHRLSGSVCVGLSAAFICLYLYLIRYEGFGGWPLERFMIFEDGWVTIAFFTGAGAMGLVVRKLDERPGPRPMPPARESGRSRSSR